MITSHPRTDNDRDNDASDERHWYSFFALGARCLSLGRDGDDLGDRQKKRQRREDERIHILRAASGECKLEGRRTSRFLLVGLYGLIVDMVRGSCLINLTIWISIAPLKTRGERFNGSVDR